MNSTTLDGRTIVRFTLSFRQGGGIEEYLANLNKILLSRNSMIIIQMSLQEQDASLEKTVQKIGKGYLIQVPVSAVYDRNKNWNSLDIKAGEADSWIRSFARDHLIYNPILGSLIFNKLRENRRIGNLGIDARDGARIYKNIIDEYSPDLLLFHSLGSEQTARMADLSSQRAIPYVYINHYTNRKFSHFCIREQIRDAVAVAGVSSVEVPRYIRKRFVNLLDGIDVDFFNCSQISDFGENGRGQIVFLPARVAPGKGHGDLIHAAAILNDQGVNCKLVFAGRKDSPDMLRYLEDLIEEKGISDSVQFLGHCNPAELREWYAKSSVIVLPSSTEGLPRVLLEAQAMSKPVVSYNVGGAPECMEHKVSGYLCRQGDIGQLASYLKKLMENDTFRDMMGRKGMEFVRNNFTLLHLAKRHEEFYCMAMEGKKGEQLSCSP